jgi:endonuclease-3 related protein
MHDQLAYAYGSQRWWPAETPFEVILGAYLTQNTSWKAVERSLANLRAAGALTLDGLRALSLDELRRLIQPSGFFTRKAPALKAFVAMVDDEFGGSLEALAAVPAETLRGRLLALPGVGPSGSCSRRVSAPHRRAAWAACWGAGAHRLQLTHGADTSRLCRRSSG